MQSGTSEQSARMYCLWLEHKYEIPGSVSVKPDATYIPQKHVDVCTRAPFY